jgi:diguanylate cyclase (GGDEF)-like protein
VNAKTDQHEPVAALADTEAQRLEVIAELGLLGRLGDPVLTALTRLAQSVTGAEAAAVHVFDAHYQRRIAAAGAPLVDHPAEGSMCRLVVQEGARIVTPDATADLRFAYSSFVTDPVAPVRFYAAVPLRSGSGVTVGTLCAFDTRSFELPEEQIERLEDIAEVARVHLELMRIATQLGKAASLDPLTGAVNQVIFDDRVAHALARRRRRGTPVVVAVLDLDDFKALNDSHGHACGDAALKWVAGRLRDCVRSEDTVGRLGGDEFAVVAEVADGHFDRLLRKLHRVAEDFEPMLSVSIGTVIANDHDDVASLLRRADQAMYADKLKRKRPQDIDPA